MANPRVRAGGSRVPIFQCHSFSLSLGCGELAVTQKVLGSSFFGPVLHVSPLGNCQLSLLCQIVQQDTMLGAGLMMEAWAQNSGQGGPGNPDPQETQQGPRGETQDRAEAPGRGPSQEVPSHERDLCGGTAGGRTTSQGGQLQELGPWWEPQPRNPSDCRSWTHHAGAMWPHLLSGT